MNVTPDTIIQAYSLGIFPMADSANSQCISWIKPKKRGIIHIEEFHVPKTLKKFIKRGLYDITIDHAFEEVISYCSQKTEKRPTTWINTTIHKLYIDLFYMGYAHSIEAWKDGNLVGGLYGLSLGAIFFGESMFSNTDNASKVCLVHLVEHIKKRKFLLIDTQFITDHLKQFGAIEIPHSKYIKILKNALEYKDISFNASIGNCQ
ncbi:MAG: leucyl/phenylalanyl-tRNA--protein transferase [Candidatus Liberibacter europaeus]|uniref:Leucyl/phenylalanyl-tRNA--protein transferase n=1 Tax=Candidatus Liberibacter europaeus TaxID=744859 RepID=A0A2T4VY18_9HYPH|nr:leucyl/phenylalanyl-tRNA--protein transferase [Candidatus Liberibacter europaeus]PTL86673.1 MAG: leucyl/phenylalanyl-tRNA--protein transferase [Candidatus Liberibacter europaeus]